MTAAAPRPDEYTFEAYQPETWPPIDDFQEQWDARFPDGYRVAEYIAARVEYEHVTGQRPLESPGESVGMFGRDAQAALHYWRLFWTFDGPLYKPFVIEHVSEPGGPMFRVEARQMRLIPEHERRTMVEAYWEPKK